MLAAVSVHPENKSFPGGLLRSTDNSLNPSVIAPNYSHKILIPCRLLVVCTRVFLCFFRSGTFVITPTATAVHTKKAL